MRIIKHGNMTERLFICKRCKCQFAATIDDCELISNFIYCPECDNLFTWDEGYAYSETAGTTWVPSEASISTVDYTKYPHTYTACRNAGVDE